MPKECQYKHQVKEETAEPAVPAQSYVFNRFNEWSQTYGEMDTQVDFGMIMKQPAIINEFNTNKSLEGKVLLDTGANEVVRSFSHREWSNIDMGRSGTRKNQVKLAGNKWHGAGMTASGEYMIVPLRQMGTMQEPDDKGPWMCPIIRCRRQLGIHLNCDDNGCSLYGGKLQVPIEA